MTDPGVVGMIARTEMIMGLPVSVHVRAAASDGRSEPVLEAIASAFDEMRRFDQIFSPFRADSTLTAVRAGRLPAADAGPEFAEMLRLAGEAKRMTDGAFDVHFSGELEPSGLVKGWAAERAGAFLASLGHDWYLNAGGDITCGALDQPWRFGVEHPADPAGLITVVALPGGGMATSGSAHRGAHIIDPASGVPTSGIRQVTVVGASLTRADIWATAIAARGHRALVDPADPLLPTCVGDGCQVFAVSDEGKVYATAGFANAQVEDLPRPQVVHFASLA